MFGRISKISEIWKSKAFRAVFLCLAFLIIITITYKAIPHPYILDDSSPDSPHKVTFSAPFTLRFNQNMNKKSVEDSFKIHPKVKGDFIWPDGKTLEYHPSSHLDIGDNYRIIIEKTAVNIYKKSLNADHTLHFIVTGSPFVKFVSPYIEAKEKAEVSEEDDVEEDQVAPQADPVPIVSSDQIITVMFDRPMEWSSINKKDLLVIDPPVKGEYRFIGMSAFQFIPDAWPTGTRFKLKVASDISARDGGKTEEEFIWMIETSPLHVTEINPENDFENMGINQSIIVHFSQPVDLNQIKPGTNVLLYPSNDLDSDKNPKFDGFFNTEVTYGKNANGDKDKSILVFQPTFDYLPETEYRFLLKTGLSVLSDSNEILGMKENFELKFKTIPASGLAEFTPPDEENSSIFLVFHTPMTIEELKKGIVFTPEPLNPPGIILNEDNTQAEIICQFDSNKQYTFQLKKGILDVSGNEIKSDFKKTFTSPAFQTKLKWIPDGNNNLFIKGIDPEFSIRSKNTNELNLKLCTISDQNFISINEKQGWNDYKCHELSESIKISSDDTQTTLLNLTALFDYNWKSGIYYFSADGGGEKIYKVFFVSDTALILKKSTNSLLVWATDLMTGKPVSRMELVFYSYDGSEIARGVTDGDGIYKITRELGEGIYIIGKKNLENENRWSFLHEYWPAPKSTRDSIQWIESNESRLYLTSDKNKISAGESINVKGIWRIDNDAQLTLPEDTQIKLILENKEYELILKETIPLRRNGSFDVKIEVPLNISPGKYNFIAYNAVEKSISSNNLSIEILNGFSDFEMEWLSSQNNFVEGDITAFNLGARYEIGIPAVNLRGKWNLYKKSFYLDQKTNNAFYSFGKISDLLCSEGVCSSEEQWVNEGDFIFDQNGIAQIVLTDKEGNLKSGYEYKLVTVAEGINGKQISKEFVFRIHKGAYYTGLSLKHYILNSGDSAEGNLIAFSPENYSVADKKIKISLIHTVNGKENKVWYEKIFTTEAESVDFSIPIISKMPTGIYKLKAESQDGGSISELEIYVLSEKTAKLKDDFVIFFDQPEYFVGGKAHLLINYPYYESAVKALVTYEKGGIIGYQTVDLNAPLTSIEIPITEEMTPNMYVSVTAISNPNNISTLIKSQEKRRLEAEKTQKEVEIILMEQELILLSESEDPDNIRIDILKEKIESLKNIQISTEVTNGIDIQIEDAQPKIETASVELIITKRDREIYIDIKSEPLNPKPGEEVAVKIHTYDYQNRPIQSVVTLNLIKKEQNNLLPDPFGYFYNPRGSQVFNSSNITLNQSLKTINQIPSFLNIADHPTQISYSSYFNPIILTDESGYAEIKLILPSEYTNWQISAFATNEAKNFGSAVQNIPINKSLLIHPVTPNFVIPGDKLIVSTVIQNLSSQDIELKVELSSEDIKIKGGSKKAILVQAGKTAKLDWDVEINTFIEKKSLKLIFNSSEDSVEKILPIKHFTISESLSASGFIENELFKNLRIASNAIPEIGGLFASLSSTPINIIQKYANAIQNYNYSSTEKLASELIAKTILQNPEFSDMKTKEMTDAIQVLIIDIASRQNQDGGYAFWKDDESDPWLTAYVLFAIKKAHKSEISQSSAIQFLWNNLDDVSFSDRLFILWALSEVGQYDTKSIVSAFQYRDESSIADRAFLLMNIKNLIDAGQKSVYPYLEKLQSEIVDKQTTDKELIYFEEENGNGLSTDIRTTAIVLLALNKLQKDNLLTPSIVKYLTLTAINNFTPQQGIWIAIALSEFVDDYKISDIDYKAKLSINNGTLIKEDFTDKNTDQIYESFLPLGSLKSPDQINEIAIEKTGTGPLYLNADLTYFLSNDSISPLEEDLSISRNYYNIEDFKEIIPLSVLKTGNLYRGVLTLIVSEDLKYIIIEEALPAGVKALSFNPALANSSYYYEQQKIAQSQGLNWIDNSVWNFDSFKIEDDRLLIFAKNLPAGVYKIDYLAQAIFTGKFNHLPATIHQTLNPSIYARTNGEWIEIK